MLQGIKNTVYTFIAKFIPGISAAGRKAEMKKIRNRPNTMMPADFVLGEGSGFHLVGAYSNLHIGAGVSFRKYCNIMLFPGASMTLGKNVFFNNYCSLNCLDKIEIGENTLFGEGIRIYDHNHGYTFDPESGLEVKSEDFSTAPVRIGKNCWIGSNVTILKGVEIGDNVIVGANCLVYRSIPANSIVKHTENLVITPFH